MNKFLDTYLSKPIEREYEAWVVQSIHDYFQQIGIKADIWSVSPSEEVHWPADERLFVKGKIVGLQFKQAKIDLHKGSNQPDYSRLKWTFHNPPGQFQLIQAHPEIYYCLPTFIDRRLFRFALQHCLFWRPDATQDYNAWYNNDLAHTPYKSIHSSSRWGHFIEQILSCKIGERFDSLRECEHYLKELYNGLRRPFDEFMDQPVADAEKVSDTDGFYLLYIELVKKIELSTTLNGVTSAQE